MKTLILFSVLLSSFAHASESVISAERVIDLGYEVTFNRIKIIINGSSYKLNQNSSLDFCHSQGYQYGHMKVGTKIFKHKVYDLSSDSFESSKLYIKEITCYDSSQAPVEGPVSQQ